MKDRKKASSKRPADPVFRSREERIAAGRLLREHVPRSSHATWPDQAGQRDPIAILEQSNEDRLPELVPICSGLLIPDTHLGRECSPYRGVR